MCGRYTAAPTRADEISDRLGVSLDEKVVSLVTDRYNVAPRQEIAVVRETDGERAVRVARWGLLPRWAKTSRDRLQPINARSDKVLDSKMWRPLMDNSAKRVLIPATGWYEWLHAERRRGERPAPFHHVVDDGALFAFAGLMNTTRVDDMDDPITTAAIIVTDANGPASRLHDRMPVVLADPETMAAWVSADLDADDAAELLVPLADDRVTLHAASRLANSVRNSGPELLDPSND